MRILFIRWNTTEVGAREANLSCMVGIPVTRVSNVYRLEEAEFDKLTSTPSPPIPPIYNCGNCYDGESCFLDPRGRITNSASCPGWFCHISSSSWVWFATSFGKLEVMDGCVNVAEHLLTSEYWSIAHEDQERRARCERRTSWRWWCAKPSPTSVPRPPPCHLHHPPPLHLHHHHHHYNQLVDDLLNRHLHPSPRSLQLPAIHMIIMAWRLNVRWSPLIVRLLIDHQWVITYLPDVL